MERVGDVREKNREEVTGPEAEQHFARQMGGWIEGRAGSLRRRNRTHKGRVESSGVFGAARVQSNQSTEGTGGRVARGRQERPSVVRPQKRWCGRSLRDLGCLYGPRESVEK